MYVAWRAAGASFRFAVCDTVTVSLSFEVFVERARVHYDLSSNRVRDRARFVLRACAPGAVGGALGRFARFGRGIGTGWERGGEVQQRVKKMSVYKRTLDDMPHFETAFVTRRGQSRGLRAPVDTQTTKDRRTGSGRPRSPSGAAAQFPSVRRPSPRAMVVLAHDHSHIPFPSCNYTLVHIHTHERTAQAIVSGEGQFAVRTRAHAATPSAHSM